METLILVGASVRAMALSAVRAGYAPYAIDFYADRDLADLCPSVRVASYGRELLEALAAAPDAPWLYTGGLENHPRLVDRLAALRPLLGNPGAVLRRVRKPTLLAAVSRRAGLEFPAMCPVSERPADKERWLVKARGSSGGLGVWLGTDMQPQARRKRGEYLQQYIQGEAASSVFAAAGGNATLLGTTRQLLGRDFALNRPFLYAGSLGPLLLREEETASLRRLGDLLAKEFGLAGLFNVDYVRTADAIWVIEVNPRYSASIEVLERVSDIDFLHRHIAECAQSEILPQDTAAPNRFAGKAIVYARADAIVSSALERVIEQWNVPRRPVGIADLPRIGDQIAIGQPAVTVFAEAGTAEAAEVELRRRVEEVQGVLSTEY